MENKIKLYFVLRKDKDQKTKFIAAYSRLETLAKDHPQFRPLMFAYTIAK